MHFVLSGKLLVCIVCFSIYFLSLNTGDHLFLCSCFSSRSSQTPAVVSILVMSVVFILSFMSKQKVNYGVQNVSNIWITFKESLLDLYLAQINILWSMCFLSVSLFVCLFINSFLKIQYVQIFFFWFFDSRTCFLKKKWTERDQKLGF